MLETSLWGVPYLYCCRCSCSDQSGRCWCSDFGHRIHDGHTLLFLGGNHQLIHIGFLSKDDEAVQPDGV
ncbi:hypothetical protein AMECASPLE_002401 [Ameca splendens]|uniref:Uncharacterized protein n=1 Tax=Ameca splendens TaxID=208324 RepID=A0ABV1A753_9TELE